MSITTITTPCVSLAGLGMTADDLVTNTVDGTQGACFADGAWPDALNDCSSNPYVYGYGTHSYIL